MSELGLEKIIAGCYANNIGSIKALEKAGFIKEGHLKSHWFINEKRQDVYIYGKINSK